MNNIVLDKVIIDENTVLDNLDSNNYDIKDNVRLVVNISSSNLSNCVFNLGEYSHLIINKLYKENEVEEDVTVNLNGVCSRVDYNFSTITSSNQKYVININHNNINTSSNVINHGVVMNDSSLIFEVNSRVYKGNKGSSLNQESKIIVMSKNNSIIKPNLFIDEFDVDARHAATIGRFSREDIFYLMSKGINKDDSINLLINGFLNGHIGR